MLRKLVERINDTFSQNFQEMAVAGEVSLGIFFPSSLILTVGYAFLD
jgi:hypothetical protein